MRALILLMLSISFFIASRCYVSISLTQKGEYRAKLYVINDYTSRLDITSNINKSDFISHSYLSSPGLSNVVEFISKGSFVDDDNKGGYAINYTMKRASKVTVLDINKANLYIDMASRVGKPIDEKIKLIYQSNNISVFDINRNNNIIMYMKDN